MKTHALPTLTLIPCFTQSEERPLRPRALRSLGHVTYVNLVRVEIAGHLGLEAVLDCEVEFWGSPETGYEISSVQPYEKRKLANGRQGTQHHALPCPEWLEDRLAECIDVGSLDSRQ